MLKGFRDFILRGNVVELAVAVIIAGVFAPVVKTLNEGIIMQLVALVGGIPDFSKESFEISGTPFYWGAFVTAVLTFVITAAVVYFFVIVPMNRAMAKFVRPEVEPEAALSKDQELLIEIRDALRGR